MQKVHHFSQPDVGKQQAVQGKCSETACHLQEIQKVETFLVRNPAECVIWIDTSYSPQMVA